MTDTLISRAKRVAFQGEAGAYANLAAREARMSSPTVN